jgi:hypothetical protein
LKQQQGRQELVSMVQELGRLVQRQQVQGLVQRVQVLVQGLVRARKGRRQRKAYRLH